jgi:hypothetical protein
LAERSDQSFERPWLRHLVKGVVPASVLAFLGGGALAAEFFYVRYWPKADSQTTPILQS